MMERTYVVAEFDLDLALGGLTYVFGGKILFWLFQKGKGRRCRARELETNEYSPYLLILSIVIWFCLAGVIALVKKGDAKRYIIRNELAWKEKTFAMLMHNPGRKIDLLNWSLRLSSRSIAPNLDYIRRFSKFYLASDSAYRTCVLGIGSLDIQDSRYSKLVQRVFYHQL